MILEGIIAQLEHERVVMNAGIDLLVRELQSRMNGSTSPTKSKKKRGRPKKGSRQPVTQFVRDELSTRPQPLNDIWKAIKARGHRVARERVSQALYGLKKAGHVERTETGWRITPVS